LKRLCVFFSPYGHTQKTRHLGSKKVGYIGLGRGAAPCAVWRVACGVWRRGVCVWRVRSAWRVWRVWPIASSEPRATRAFVLRAGCGREGVIKQRERGGGAAPLGGLSCLWSPCRVQAAAAAATALLHLPLLLSCLSGHGASRSTPLRANHILPAVRSALADFLNLLTLNYYSAAIAFFFAANCM
jgi:hypothetical protein